MTVWRLDTGAKAVSEERRNGGNNSTTGAISPGKQMRRGVEAYEELKECMAKKNIISTVIYMNRHNLCICDFIAVDKQGNLSAKDVIGDNAQDAREIS